MHQQLEYGIQMDRKGGCLNSRYTTIAVDSYYNIPLHMDGGPQSCAQWIHALAEYDRHRRLGLPLFIAATPSRVLTYRLIGWDDVHASVSQSVMLHHLKYKAAGAR